ncbi:SAR2788 family putative toxin [Bacillus sp. FJAT-47783]|uniref:SAR2788 family putative toxin n=1 Tax=Bacillus sp. FJAT-47783 TaxID=2922712 RepID=UPI001FACB9B9|nr:SAR2788 family putative toxin [Bacillus sp. FJAT-47783]
MKRYLIRILVLTLMISGIMPSFSSANSSENIIETGNDNVRVEESNGEEYEVNIEEELNVDLEEDIEMKVKEVSHDEVVVSTELETEDLLINTDMSIDEGTGEVTLTGTTELENGQEATQSFNVVFEEIVGTDFVATFIDRKTGESYQVNTIDAQASIAPAIIVGLVARYGIKWAIKKYGKKFLIKTFKNQAIKKAIKKVANFSVSNKHLSNAGGNYRKFNTTSKSQVNKWIKEALNSKNVSVSLNDSKKLSFIIIADLGKKIGTKGETKIKIVIGWDSIIWTAYPIK